MRRIIQLRLAIAVGWAAIGTQASANPGCETAHCHVSMPPIELPSTRRRWRTPSPSVSRRYEASTMSA